MDAKLDRMVRQRAGGRCEYCHLPQVGSRVPFEVDHIIARKHGGPTIAGNLAISCLYCNAYKGPNISGLDPSTGKLTRLYHPRRHRWSAHFRYQGRELGRPHRHRPDDHPSPEDQSPQFGRTP